VVNVGTILFLPHVYIFYSYAHVELQMLAKNSLNMWPSLLEMEDPVITGEHHLSVFVFHIVLL
jgi:hypothetical protein